MGECFLLSRRGKRRGEREKGELREGGKDARIVSSELGASAAASSFPSILSSFISLPNLTSEIRDKSPRYPFGTSSGFLGCRLTM